MCCVVLDPCPLRDDTRTSYLLHGVESAWESTGKKRPPTLSANHSAESSSRAERDARSPQNMAVEKGAELKGAECMIDIPHKGDNVSLSTLFLVHLFNILFFPLLFICLLKKLLFRRHGVEEKLCLELSVNVLGFL